MYNIDMADLAAIRVKRKALQLFLFFLVLSTLTFAQKTVVSGKVTESKTGEPIPYATVVFKGTYIGTMTDLNGNFNLSTLTPTASVEISCIGYKKKEIPVKAKTSAKLTIALDDDMIMTGEVVVKPGENPAIPLFKKILDHKKENNPSNFPSWHSRLYSKTEVDIKNVDKSLRTKKLLKSFDFVFDYIDSLKTEGKAFLPVFFSETFSNYYHQEGSAKDREEIVANKASGMTSNMITKFTGKVYEGLNPYDNYLMISDVSMISPMNGLGLQFYKFYLLDSLKKEGKTYYELSFKPRNPQSPAFKGSMWVESESFALTKIDLQLSEKANINFVNNFKYAVEFEKAGDRWTPKKESIVLDVDIQKNQKSKRIGIIGRKTNFYEDFTFGQVAVAPKLDANDQITVHDDAMNKDEKFWENSRPMELQKREFGIYKMVDSIKHVPLYKTATEYVYMFYYGYRDLGKIELGQYYSFYSHNPVEGDRFKLGARTTLKFDKNLRLNGYAAYGNNDKEFKYGGGFEYYFSKKPKDYLSLQYKHDYDVLGKSKNAFMMDNILNTLLNKRPYNKLNLSNKLEINYEKEWFSGFSNKFTFNNTELFSGPFVKFETPAGTILPNIRYSELTLNTRYAPNEYYVQDGFERSNFENSRPIFNVNLTAGLKGFMGGQYNYYKADAQINQKLLLHPLGFSYYSLQVGKIWGDVPFPLMKIHEGNDTYAYDILAFNMMNMQEFVSDQYASLFIEHHFQGFFLNKIPLFKRLKWRELVGVRALYGNYDPAKHAEMLFPTGMKGLQNSSYTEFSVGLENIFKVLKIMGVWRSVPFDDGSSRFGVVGTLQLVL
ncbi:MAG: DUF5686 and carboxypeptidase regulatory-like domain-containing protein [Marinilabiliales bacterium]|nr:DUF5686 and carboxypeptidase regulatory-like domain-containing protein [Marinilabiliales bacterium]